MDKNHDTIAFAVSLIIKFVDFTPVDIVAGRIKISNKHQFTNLSA